MSGVKSVQEDLGIETARPLLRAQAVTSEECDERMCVDSCMQGEVAIAVKSSAYDEMNRLKRAGEMTEPCGTPAWTGLGGERWLL